VGKKEEEREWDRNSRKIRTMGANCYPVKKHADDDHDYGLGKSKKKQKKQHGEEEEHDHHNPHPYSHYYPTSGSTLRLTKKFSSLAGETSTAKTSVEDTIRAKSLGFEPGCYMTFNPGNLGVLFQQWAFRSTDFKDDEIWAYFQPGRQVPRYKFNTHNGKSELLRKHDGDNDRMMMVMVTIVKVWRWRWI